MQNMATRQGVDVPADRDFQLADVGQRIPIAGVGRRLRQDLVLDRHRRLRCADSASALVDGVMRAWCRRLPADAARASRPGEMADSTNARDDRAAGDIRRAACRACPMSLAEKHDQHKRRQRQQPGEAEQRR